MYPEKGCFKWTEVQIIQGILDHCDGQQDRSITAFLITYDVSIYSAIYTSDRSLKLGLLEVGLRHQYFLKLPPPPPPTDSTTQPSLRTVCVDFYLLTWKL